MIASCIFLGIILLVGVTGFMYARSLLNLVKEPEFTGNPSVRESDIFEPEETVVNLPDSSQAIQSAAQEIKNVQSVIPVPQDKDVYNILLIGSDQRDDESFGRSDTMMILSVNKRTSKISLVSLMRGLYVQIPEHGYGMLNASFAYGGASMLLKTIEDNLRVHIDDYVSIKFSGFVKAIDAVGGVNITLSQAEIDQIIAEIPTSTVKKGNNLLNGAEALTFARIRKIDSDYKRTGRQREVIEALIKKLTSLSIGKIDSTARQLLPLVKTNLSGSALVGLAIDGLKYRGYPVTQLMLPIDGSHRMIVVRGTQMESFDVKKNVEALHQQLYG